jgi:hypothetical protein
MQTCEQHDHCVVIYDSRNCPVCELIDDYDEKIFNKNERIEQLQIKLDER